MDEMATTTDVPDSGIEPEDVRVAVRKALSDFLNSDAVLTVGFDGLKAALTTHDKEGEPIIVPYFYAFWETVVEVISTTSEASQQQKLADLILALPDFHVGTSMYSNGEKVEVFSEMPKWEETVHEIMRSLRIDLEGQKKRCANLHAFLVRVHPRWDFLQYGVGALSALEYTENLDFWIPIAARWIELHGEKFLGSGPHNGWAWQDVISVVPGPLLQGASAGLSRERWDFWAGRLEDLQESNELKNETKMIAKRMVDQMAQIIEDIEEDESEEEDEYEVDDDRGRTLERG